MYTYLYHLTEIIVANIFRNKNKNVTTESKNTKNNVLHRGTYITLKTIQRKELGERRSKEKAKKPMSSIYYPSCPSEDRCYNFNDAQKV